MVRNPSCSGSVQLHAACVAGHSSANSQVLMPVSSCPPASREKEQWQHPPSSLRQELWDGKPNGVKLDEVLNDWKLMPAMESVDSLSGRC